MYPTNGSKLKRNALPQKIKELSFKTIDLGKKGGRHDIESKRNYYKDDEEFSDETLTLVRFKFMQSAPNAVLFNYPNHGPLNTNPKTF